MYGASSWNLISFFASHSWSLEIGRPRLHLFTEELRDICWARARVTSAVISGLLKTGICWNVFQTTQCSLLCGKPAPSFLGENNINETLVLGVFIDLCLLIKEPVTELAMISCFRLPGTKVSDGPQAGEGISSPFLSTSMVLGNLLKSDEILRIFSPRCGSSFPRQ